jgi:hypothetical protein
MTQWLKQSTASDRKVGPFVDKTDGLTAETGLTTASTGVHLSKNGGALTDKHEGTAIAHDSLGYYVVKLDTTDTDTLGSLKLVISDDATHLPVWQEFMVVPANVWDSFFGASLLIVDAAAAKAVVDNIHDTDLPAVKADTAAILTDTGTTLDGALASVASTLTDVHNTDLPAVKADTAAVKLQTDKLAFTTANKVDARAFTVDDKTGYTATVSDKTGFALTSAYDKAKDDVLTPLAVVDGNVDAILADTNELQTNQGAWATATGFGTATNLAAVKTVVDEIPTNAELATALGTADDATLAAIAAVSTKIGTPQQTDLSTELHNVHAHVASYVGNGAGASTWTYTLTTSGGTPIPDAEVWVSTDSAGSDVVASGSTSNLGAVTFMLDPGDYYIWSQRAGYNFANPDLETVP